MMLGSKKVLKEKKIISRKLLFFMFYFNMENKKENQMKIKLFRNLHIFKLINLYTCKIIIITISFSLSFLFFYLFIYFIFSLSYIFPHHAYVAMETKTTHVSKLASLCLVFCSQDDWI